MGIIKDIWHKCKTEWFVGLVFILGLLLAFGLGRWSAGSPLKTAVTISYPDSAHALATPSALSAVNSTLTNNKNDVGGKVVASREGSKYHYPWCSGAKRIKPDNLVEYENVAAARAAGLTPAENCPGLN